MLVTSKKRNQFLTDKLLKQWYQYQKNRKAFSKFYHRHPELMIVKYKNGLHTSAIGHMVSGILWCLSLSIQNNC